MVSFCAPFSYVTAVRLIKGPYATDGIPFYPFVTVRVIIGPEATKAVTVRLVPVSRFFPESLCLYLGAQGRETSCD